MPLESLTARMFGRRNQLEDEETEEEKLLKLTMRKKQELILTLEQDFDLRLNQKKVLHLATLSKQNVTIPDEKWYEEPEDVLADIEPIDKGLQENSYVGLKIMYDQLHHRTSEMEKAVVRFETGLKTKELLKMSQEIEDEKVSEDRLAELETKIELMRYRIYSEEQEFERMANREKQIKADTLILRNDTEEVARAIKFVDRLVEKQRGLQDSRYTALERTVREFELELMQERVAKDIILSQLEAELNKVQQDRMKTAAEIADWMMESEKCNEQLEEIKGEISTLDLETAKYTGRTKEEMESLQIVQTLNTISNFIDDLRTSQFPFNRGLTGRESQVPTKPEMVRFNNIDTLFENPFSYKKKPTRYYAAHEDFSEIEDTSRVRAVSRSNNDQPRSGLVSRQSMIKSKKNSSNSLSVRVNNYKDQLEIFTKANSEQEPVAEKIISSYNKISARGRELELKLARFVELFKEKTEILHICQRLLSETERTEARYKHHRNIWHLQR